MVRVAKFMLDAGRAFLFRVTAATKKNLSVEGTDIRSCAASEADD